MMETIKMISEEFYPVLSEASDQDARPAAVG